MRVDGVWRRAIERGADGQLVVLDQAALPHRVAWLALRTLEDACRAIRDMTVRGAPLIGATAAYGVALAAHEGIAVDDACRALAATRPTAVNLAWALAQMRAHLAPHAGAPSAARAELAFARAAQICDDEVARCEAIGRHGLAVLEALARGPAAGRPLRVLTHCNAGWLATVDWGTALAPIYRAHDAGLAIEVWVDETRPRNQGLLTAWELAQHGVPHTVIADNAGGHLMQRGLVDVCIVGTDRTTRAGDVCNKIGTYLKALAAHDTGVPFYVAAPSPSIDWQLLRGEAIPIEERAASEVRHVSGVLEGEVATVALIAPGTRVANPAFDVTPARLITGLLTERGVCAATEAGLAARFPDLARGAPP